MNSRTRVLCATKHVKLEPSLHCAIADRIHYINVILAISPLKQANEFTDVVAAQDGPGPSNGGIQQ